MEHPIDVDIGHRRALERRQQDTAQGIAERQAEAPLERLGHDLGGSLGIDARLNVQLVRFDQFGPVVL